MQKQASKDAPRAMASSGPGALIPIRITNTLNPLRSAHPCPSENAPPQSGRVRRLDRVPRDHVAPGTPRRPDTYTVSGTLHSQLGSANRYRWLAPADSRCEDMPNTTPPPPPTLARAHGTAHGRPTVGNASAPTDAYPSSHPASHAAGHARCSRAPHATQRAHTGPSRSLPSIGLPVLLFRCTTTQLQTLSPSAPRRERQVVHQHHGASGR